MKKITKYTDYDLNESTIEVETTEEGVYVLTLHDIHNIVNNFTDEEVTEEDIIEELSDYTFVKVDDPELEVVEDETIDTTEEEIEDDELASNGDITGLKADEDPTLIKKFEE